MVQIATHLSVGFAGGLLGFAHCLGMCGGFAVNLSLGEEMEQNDTRSTAVASWRDLCTYAFLGAAAGYGGAYMQELLFRHTHFQNLLSYIAGAIAVLMGAPAARTTALPVAREEIEQNDTLLLLSHLGKICTYAFLGAAAGYGGAYMQELLFRHTHFQNLLSYIAGAIIVLMGARLLGLLPFGNLGQNNGDGLAAAIYRRLFAKSTPGSALVMGIATGLLPCPIVLALLTYSLQSGSVVTGLATMGALGIGTMLPLLALGFASRLTVLRRLKWSSRAGGIVLVTIGVITIMRGTEIYHHLLGCPPEPIFQKAGADLEKPCCAGKVPGSEHGK